MTDKKRNKRVKCYVGFCDGKLYWYSEDEYYGGAKHADIFKTLKAAKVCYADIRKATLIIEG